MPSLQHLLKKSKSFLHVTKCFICFSFSLSLSLSPHQLTVDALRKMDSLTRSYDLTAVCDSSQSCLQTLLEDDHVPQIDEQDLARRPCNSAVDSLRRVLAIQGKCISL